MSEFSSTATIMYPSRWPEDVVDAHCTLVYLGEIPELDYGLDLVLMVMNMFTWPDITMVATKPVEMFGPDKDIPVVPLVSRAVEENRSYIVQTLTAHGLTYDNTWPDFKPHISVPSADIEVPGIVALKRPEVWWGDEHYQVSK